MLCDDIAETLGQETGQILAGAERFVLKRDAVTAAVNVSMTKPSSLVRGASLCRLPYEACWLEWSFADEMDASGVPGHNGRAGAILRTAGELNVGIVDLYYWPANGKAP